MRLLVTGATGFIGSNFAERSTIEGDEVHVIVRQTSDLGRLPSVIDKRNVHVFDGSLGSLLKAMEISKPEVVVHLASLFIVSHEPEQVASLVQSNILFGALLLEAMNAWSVHSFVNTGSFWQHFGTEKYNPANLYAATKEAFVDILRYYVEATLLRAITLELPDTFGPQDPRRKIVNILIESATNRIPLGLTLGEQVLDLVHIDDVVEAFRIAIRLVMKANVRNAVYSVSSGRPIKLKDLVSIVESITGNHSYLTLGGRTYRFREVMSPWEGGTLLPGWQATRRIEDFFREQITPESDSG